MPTKPSDKALSAWYSAQPERDYTCSDCGKVGPKWMVQPQHPYYAGGREGEARCPDCLNAINRRMREARKAQLAGMPRCEVPGCRRRANWQVGSLEPLGMCGHHKRKAQTAHQRAAGSLGGLGLFMPAPAYTRAEYLRMATGSRLDQDVTEGELCA